MFSDRVMISLASRQIWPQVLSVLHFRPAALWLLHSDDREESAGPAERLRHFLCRTSHRLAAATHLKRIAHDNFAAIMQGLDALDVDPQRALLNFTGGNKLMATAAFTWAVRLRMRAFYLERGAQVIMFTPDSGGVSTQSLPLDVHLADDLDPLELLRCQMGEAEVERAGQRVTLSVAGRKLGKADLPQYRDRAANLQDFFDIEGQADGEVRAGDALEWYVALIVLVLGVRMVRRSLRIKARSRCGRATYRPMAEFDLVFNFGGRLWLVDCKDAAPAAHLVDRLQPHVAPAAEARALLEDIRDRLAVGEARVIKEDLLHIRQMGGLLGQVVCVRRSKPAPDVLQFARDQKVEIIQRGELVERWDALLNPQRPASAEELHHLTQEWGH